MTYNYNATFTVQCHVNTARSSAGKLPLKRRRTNKQSNRRTFDFYEGTDIGKTDPGNKRLCCYNDTYVITNYVSVKNMYINDAG